MNFRFNSSQDFVMEAYADPLQYFPPDPANETNPQQVLNYLFYKQCVPPPPPDLQPLRQVVITMGKENFPTHPHPNPQGYMNGGSQI
jgi:hypothetical protein